jgi:hypothetical protein
VSGIVEGICISPNAGEAMQEMQEVQALAGSGLQGDRYASGEGSFNRGVPGKRQVTLMNALFFDGSAWQFADSRGNIFTRGVELMWLIGREFQVGEARFRGIKYCDPCVRPSKLLGKQESFALDFHDRGGLVAEVIEGGVIRVGGAVIPPPRGY